MYTNIQKYIKKWKLIFQLKHRTFFSGISRFIIQRTISYCFVLRILPVFTVFTISDQMISLVSLILMLSTSSKVFGLFTITL